MSVISTYTARVTISVFITIIALLPNTSNGQSHEQNYYYHRRIARVSSDTVDTSQSDAKEVSALICLFILLVLCD